MQLGKIKKEVICSIKDSALTSAKLFLVQLLNLNGEGSGDYVVAVENGLSLGKGDKVIVVQGSAARLLYGNKKMPIDCAVSAKVDSVFIYKKYSSILLK